MMFRVLKLRKCANHLFQRWAMIGGMGDQEFVRRVEFRALK